MRNPILSGIVLLILLNSVCYGQKIGIATHFEALGTPYGACGVPVELLETPNFVALNVFNRPNYAGSADFTRPLRGADTVLTGEFANGRNCGRWVKVTILDDCKNGPNSGDLGKTSCTEPGASWMQDQYNGAELYMIVTDACGDNNAWCREIPYHLDLHTSSLKQFVENGEETTEMYPEAFNNRKIQWEYVKAPNFSGDIKVYFMQNSQKYWASILITHLENGIHGVEQKINEKWEKLEMNSDMGQAFILKDPANEITIRVYDSDDHLLHSGREYKFTNPCLNQPCISAATEVSYEVPDCNGDLGGTAFVDSCRICSGGNTGIIPELDIRNCITLTNKSETMLQLRVFPVPVRDYFQLNSEIQYKYRIYNSNGKLIKTGNTVSQTDIRTLVSGVYFLHLHNGNSYYILKMLK